MMNLMLQRLQPSRGSVNFIWAQLYTVVDTFHLNLTADVGNAEYQARYLGPLGRKLVVSECERTVQATVLCP